MSPVFLTLNLSSQYANQRFCSSNQSQKKLGSRYAQRTQNIKKSLVRNSSSETQQIPVAQEELYDDYGLKQLESMKTRFQIADLDGNGVIDREELRALLESTEGGQAYLTTRWMADEDLDEIMKAYDTDQSGDISFDEFVKLCEDGILLEGTLQEYEEAFNAADKSGNGKLGATELAWLFRNLGEPLSYEELVQIMMKYDKDESGQIEFEEFLEMFRSKQLLLDDVLAYMKMVPKESPKIAGVQPIPRKGPMVLPKEVTMIFSEEELNDLVNENPNQLSVIFAGLTWCRPCKAIQRPYQKLAEAYPDVRFIKFYGNSNDNTKNLFKNRLKARASPSFFFIRDGEVVHSHTGANKMKLETNVRKFLDEASLPQEPLFSGSSTKE